MCIDEELVNKNVEAEQNPEESHAIATPSTTKNLLSNARINLSNVTNDHDIKQDTEF